MHRKPWEKTLKGKISENNDANDYYYSWIELETEDGDLEYLVKRYIGASFNAKDVIIKVRDGAIFITTDDEE